MQKQRSPRNRTLTVNADEQELLRQQLLTLQQPVTPEQITDRTIWGDLIQVLDLLPKQFADLIIIDPPYNLTRDFAGTRFKQMSDAHYLKYLETWFSRVVECLKPGGSLYLCGDWKCTSALQKVMQEHLTVLNRITWQREKGRGAASNWKNSMEDIWFGVKNARQYTFNVEAVKVKRKVLAPYRVEGQPKDWQETEEGKFRLTYPSNFWDDITVPYWSMPENTDHPTQKPEKLIAKLILASSNEGDMVFDPFLGSGTTSVVARKLNRRFCGVEMNEAYCLLAEKRLRLAANDSSIQGYADGVFRERNVQK
ncbi:MAG: methylase [Bacteroidetes bacterium]|nr:methylase [Bacteroidota bacterium]